MYKARVLVGLGCSAFHLPKARSRDYRIPAPLYAEGRLAGNAAADTSGPVGTQNTANSIAILIAVEVSIQLTQS
jgi:hypothetical protein